MCRRTSVPEGRIYENHDFHIGHTRHIRPCIANCAFHSQSSSQEEEEVTAEPTAEETEPAGTMTTVYEDDEVTLRLLTDGQVQDITMFNYLVSVVAAEMPASFQPEALKAQAVAARTYALYRRFVSPSDNHPPADVCGDSSCCSAYKSLPELAEKWGGNYDCYLEKIEAAVRATDGVCLLYEDEPILAVFHSSSARSTEDSQNVWSSALPYLVSVVSPETGEEVPDYISSVTVAQSDFKDTICSVFPDADFSGDASFLDRRHHIYGERQNRHNRDLRRKRQRKRLCARFSIFGRRLLT